MTKTEYSNAIGRFPYASEVFGTYRPMVGWDSRRKRDRLLRAQSLAIPDLLATFTDAYLPSNTFNEDAQLERAKIGRRAPAGIHHSGPLTDSTFVLPAVRRYLDDKRGETTTPPDTGEWAGLLTRDAMDAVYGDHGRGVVAEWEQWSRHFQEQIRAQTPGEEIDESFMRALFATVNAVLDRESQMAGVLADLAQSGATGTLDALFYPEGVGLAPDPALRLQALQQLLVDPFTRFDPTNQLNGVSVSPIGIVHYFRQYFYELDTFLGPAVGHVWLAPGTTVELIESSTRKTTVERTVETEVESKVQTETAERAQDELSEAIKEENRQDTKLGFSTTVHQSWPSGDATATGTFDLDRSQQLAREATHKRMREQSQKLSTELRNSFHTTFKTVTETTDMSSKRYVLSNPGQTLQNYEMRRKMRRVAVQVQDIGSYLCWETFVDDPGLSLGLADLVHIAKPPDSTPAPAPQQIPPLERKEASFTLKARWSATPNPVLGSADPTPPNCTKPLGVILCSQDMAIDVPDGYQVELSPGTDFPLVCTHAGGEEPGAFETYPYCARFNGGTAIDVILKTDARGLAWTHDVDLDFTGKVGLVATEDRKNDIANKNEKAIRDAADAANAAEYRALEAAFYEAAQERIELAAAVKPRRFEDLREEERTVIYRKLIADLMANDARTGLSNYTSLGDDMQGNEQRHVYATVLNAIFDIDRMLYFVAAEWWKPRRHAHQTLGRKPTPPTISSTPGGQPFKGLGKKKATRVFGPDKVVTWADAVDRPDNYYITAKSEPAKLGASLGWLLQLDGDDMRNRFLNAPWVRAVIPIRPGKEQAAMAWLTQAEVEGAKGLDAKYAGEDGEAAEIRGGLAEAGLTASDPPTVGDAIRYLCLRVEAKHREGDTERLFPERNGLDDGDKVWATPIEKVYEHGFYPLERSFRANPTEPPTDGASPNFQIMAQWTEILPTDQVVPVPVEYNPITGRQLPPPPPG